MVWALWISPPGRASSAPQQPAASDAPTLHTGVSEVNLSFRVADELGRSVEDLQLSDLDLRDNGRRPLQIMSFRHTSETPVRAGILVDTSTSMYGLEHHQQVARQYVRGVLRSNTDQAFVMRFDFDTLVKQDWTADPDALNQAIGEVARDASGRLGGTALFDSLYIACRDKFKSRLASGNPVSNILILFSDGRDNRSHTRVSDVLKECQTTDTAIYAFSDASHPTRDAGQKVLRQLAEGSGGRIFFSVSQDTDLHNLQRMKSDGRDRYTVVYKPARLKPDGAFHSIKLDALKRTGFFTARRGYYAPEN